MNKRILTLFITGAVILSALSGCDTSQNAGGGTTAPQSGTVTSDNGANASEEGTNAPEGNGEENTESEGNAPAEGITAESIANAIKTAYGKNYLPNMQMDAEMIAAKFGIEADSYTEIYAESPMIGAHPDTLVIVKPAEGKPEEVKGKLDAYREQLVNDTMQYPMNIAKINASQVVVKGDYAAFILLGAINENENASDEEQAKFAEEQEKIGVDAFNKCFE